MKLFSLSLSLVIGGLILTPAAFAQQFGMDQDYHQQMQAQGPAFNSTANKGTQAYTTDTSAWQDMTYVENQYAPLHNIQAPIQNSPVGAISTFKGNQGQFLQGKMISGQSLPETRNDLQAVQGGYVNDACGLWGSGGFRGFKPSDHPYGKMLPPTSTSTVRLDTAF